MLRKHGGKLDTIGHPTTTLEDYFLRIVEESKAHPGRRFLPGKEPAAARVRSKVRARRQTGARPKEGGFADGDHGTTLTTDGEICHVRGDDL